MQTFCHRSLEVKCSVLWPFTLPFSLIAVSSGKAQQVTQDKTSRGQAASNTLRENYDVLSKQIKPQSVAPALYAKHIIDSEMLERVNNMALKTDRERAGDLLLELIRKVEAKPEWFLTILQIFEEALVPGMEELRGIYT